MRRPHRYVLTLLVALVSFGFVPIASAHGGHVSVSGIHLSQWYGLVPLVLGVGIVLASQYIPQVLRPRYARYSLWGTFAGLVIAVFGAIWLVQLSPYEWLSGQPVVPRTLYEPLLLFAGSAIALGSVLIGQYRWPRRPRYAGFGVLLGIWVAYPGLSVFGLYTENNPVGYLIVFGLAGALVYLLWRDASDVVRRLVADRIARRFGLAVGLLSVVFFMFSSGMVYLIPDEGVGVNLSEPLTSVVPVVDPLVAWPAFEFWYPGIPIGGMVSVGTTVLLVLFGGLIGLNAALYAYQSRNASGTSQTTAGVAGIAAPQACCCCGPALSQIAVVTLGPSAAAPLYLLFADPSSSIGSLFFVASVGILTGTLIRAAQRPSPPDSSRDIPTVDTEPGY